MIAVRAQAPATQPRPDPKSIVFRGDRFKPLTYDEMTPAQKTMVEHLLAGPRAGANGPFNVLLRSPEMGDIAQQFGASMRFNSSMPPKAQRAGHHHHGAPLDVAVRVVRAPSRGARRGPEPGHRRRDRGRQAADRDAEGRGGRVQLLHGDAHTKHVSDATFKTTKDAFGEKGVVDLIGVMGWYQMVSMLLNTDRYPLPDGVQPELKPLN